jgi:hypothetical protein
MMRRVRPFLILALAPLFMLAACEKPDNAPGPGGVTMGEARALDEAAQMIDARRPPPDLTQPLKTQPPEKQRGGQARPTPIDSSR